MDTQNLFKYRSVTACMRAAFDLMRNQFKSLLKATWMGFLVYSVFMAATIYLRMPNKFLHDWGAENPLMSFTLQTIVYAMGMIGSLWATGLLWGWINKKKLIRNIAYSLLSEVIVGISAAIVILLGVATAIYLPIYIGILVSFILAIFLLPLVYVNMRMVLVEDKEKLGLWKAYKMGFRHWGGLFKTGFIGLLVILVVMTVLSVPAMILTGAQALSQLGALDGDPLGTPVYFTPLFIVILALITFIYAYVSSWLTISFAYLYGSYETQEKEKKQLAAEEAPNSK